MCYLRRRDARLPTAFFAEDYPMASPLETAADPSKSRWDQVLTVTPVILTVLGTLLAGLSSSEMTLAQYYRTLAAQSQAKASDQWAFFQAKRIRGTSLELFVKQLPLLAQPTRSLREEFGTASDQLIAHFQQAAAQANQLDQAIKQARDDLGGAPLNGYGGDLVDRSRECVTESAVLREQLAKIVQDANFPDRTAWTSTLPARPPLAAGVQQALADLAAAKPTAQLEIDLLAVPVQQLQNAILDAEADAQRVEEMLAPMQEQLRELGRVVEAQVKPVPALDRCVRMIELALAGIKPGAGKEIVAVRQALAEVSRSGAEMLAAAELLRQRMNLVEQSFLARSYRLEADRNLHLAQLYELQVRQNGGLAERHRNRSRSFFYGMLCAQAGVTISSLALAARQKNLLWGLAGAAGLTALVFSLYVYLFV